MYYAAYWYVDGLAHTENEGLTEVQKLTTEASDHVLRVEPWYKDHLWVEPLGEGKSGLYSKVFLFLNIKGAKERDHHTQRKNGTKRVPLAYYCYIWYPFSTPGSPGTEIVPLRIPYYGQSNSAPRGAISVPFFLSALYIRKTKREN